MANNPRAVYAPLHSRKPVLPRSRRRRRTVASAFARQKKAPAGRELPAGRVNERRRGERGRCSWPTTLRSGGNEIVHTGTVVARRSRNNAQRIHAAFRDGKRWRDASGLRGLVFQAAMWVRRADPSKKEVSPSACASITPFESPNRATCSQYTRSPACSCRPPRSTAIQVTLCPSGAA